MKRIGRSRWSWGWDGGQMAFGARSYVDRIEVYVLALRLGYARKGTPQLRPPVLPGDAWTTDEPSPLVIPPLIGPLPSVRPAVWEIRVSQVDVPAPISFAIEDTLFSWTEPSISPCGRWLQWIDEAGARQRTDLGNVRNVSWRPKE